MRITDGMSGGRVLGWDMATAIEMGRALGVSTTIIAELLPAIEAVMVRKTNEQTRLSGLEGFDP
jgi:hypothetical protein